MFRILNIRKETLSIFLFFPSVRDLSDTTDELQIHRSHGVAGGVIVGVGGVVGGVVPWWGVLNEQDCRIPLLPERGMVAVGG